MATEIRCTEESKGHGGMKYDVILADASNDTPPKKVMSPTVNISEDDILAKLKAAEERRLSFEASKRSSAQAHFNKMEEAIKKKEEEELAAAKEKKEALEAAMENHLKKREAYLLDIKNKLKDHFDTVEKNRQSLESSSQNNAEMLSQLKVKLETADKQRSENINKMLNKLKLKDEQIEKVRKSLESRKEELMSQIEKKLTVASERKGQQDVQQLQRLKSHDERVENVRHKKQSMENKENEDEKSSA